MKITPFRGLLSYREALERLLRAARPVEEMEEVPLLEALGRVLGEEVVSSMDVPPFDRAAMDGYAVRSEETFSAGTFSPVLLKVVGEVYAGEVPERGIGRGEAMRVATGAPLPEGSDGVVPAEDTEEEGEVVRIYTPIPPYRNVTRRGSDIKEGEVALSSGEVLTPSRVGALAALGLSKVKVRRRVLVSVIPTGEEIVPPGEKLEGGRIYDINSYTLGMLVKECGGEVKVWGIVGDRREELEKALQEAIEESDVVVFSGGSSVGERDLLEEVFGSVGEILFHGVQIKPGKPLLAAKSGDKILLGIPGYPASALTSSYLFLKPLILKMGGYPLQEERSVMARMSRRVTSNLGRHQFLTVRLERDEGGYLAHPVFKESGTITSLSRADGYVEIPENVDLVERGEEVQVKLF